MGFKWFINQSPTFFLEMQLYSLVIFYTIFSGMFPLTTSQFESFFFFFLSFSANPPIFRHHLAPCVFFFIVVVFFLRPQPCLCTIAHTHCQSFIQTRVSRFPSSCVSITLADPLNAHTDSLQTTMFQCASLSSLSCGECVCFTSLSLALLKCLALCKPIRLTLK